MPRKTSWMLGLLGAVVVTLLLFLGGVSFVLGRLGMSEGVRESASTSGKNEATPTQEVALAGWGTPESGAATSAGTTESEANLTLGKDQREYLWQVEHHGLLLSSVGFARIANALKNDDEEALRTIFVDGFEGEVLGKPREAQFEHGGTRILRQNGSGERGIRLDAKSFAKFLLEDRRRFSKRPGVKLSLMALAPTDPKNLDSVWQGTCQLRMSGEMGKGRPGEVVLYLRYRIPRPKEAVLKSNPWLQSLAIMQRQVAESPKSLMKDVTATRGIDVKLFHDNWEETQNTQIVSGGVNLCDYNRDGCLDMLITDLTTNVMYQGSPDGTLTDVTSKVRLPQNPRLITATFVDLDGDGWEDLIFGSVLLRNTEGQYFTPVEAPTLAIRPQASVNVADFDRDGKMDLYVSTIGLTKAATWIKGEGGGQVRNRLWKNLGDWKFVDVTDSAGASGGNRSTFTAVWLDADEDGWPDLYVINEFGRGVLLVNKQDGTFRERAIEADPGDFGSMGVTAGDFDNDGHIDIYVGNMYSKAGNRVMANVWPGSYPETILSRLRSFTNGSQLHHNLGALKFERIGRELQVADVGWAYGPAMADLNNDGWLDIYATCGFISKSRTDPDG